MSRVKKRAGCPALQSRAAHPRYGLAESVVREAVQKAGFKLAAQGDLYRNPNDTRDWNAAPMAAKEKHGHHSPQSGSS